MHAPLCDYYICFSGPARPFDSSTSSVDGVNLVAFSPRFTNRYLNSGQSLETRTLTIELLPSRKPQNRLRKDNDPSTPTVPGVVSSPHPQLKCDIVSPSTESSNKKSNFLLENLLPRNLVDVQYSAGEIKEQIGSGGDKDCSGSNMFDGQRLSMNINDVTAAMGSPAVSPSRNMKSRQHLQLPTFKSLGIAAPHPDVLLTPPDEHDNIHWANPSEDLSHIPTNSPYHRPMSMASEGTTPETPLVSEFVSATGGETPKSSQPTASQASAPMVTPTGEGILHLSASSTQSENSDERTAWLKGAVEVTLSTMSTAGGPPHVINVLCHTQPCPLSDDATAGPSAFTFLISSLQAQVEATHDRYIEVTHAIPLKFNMARLPSSPAGTPTMTASRSSEVDYFNMTVFAKAVIAVEHHDASNASVPSSPHPVVAPSSVGVSLLERFIPPSTLQEYLDLFASDCPSVLVDRLVELSPDNGNLIFIYPTANGASTFSHKYLGPLLDPLLRTLVGIHELSADLGADVGKMAVVDHMLSYERMTTKISMLLKRINAANQRGPPPTYKIVQSNKQIIQIERKAWTEWWSHQETPRLKEVMNRYFQRALRLPQSKDITAGSLVREIVNGVEHRSYGEFDRPRQGIEVGVFVIRRTK